MSENHAVYIASCISIYNLPSSIVFHPRRIEKYRSGYLSIITYKGKYNIYICHR